MHIKLFTGTLFQCWPRWFFESCLSNIYWQNISFRPIEKKRLLNTHILRYDFVWSWYWRLSDHSFISLKVWYWFYFIYLLIYFHCFLLILFIFAFTYFFHLFNTIFIFSFIHLFVFILNLDLIIPYCHETIFYCYNLIIMLLNYKRILIYFLA